MRWLERAVVVCGALAALAALVLEGCGGVW